MDDTTEPDPVPAAQPDPVRRWTYIVAGLLLALLAYNIAADRLAPITYQTTAETLVVPARGSSGRRGAASGIGGPLWQQDIHRALQRDLTACCLPPHRVHDLRHTFVSLCADAGMAADVATRWTHAPTSTSARHLYLVPSWARQCAEMLKLQVVPRRRAASRGVADAAFGFSTSPPMGDGNG